MATTESSKAKADEEGAQLKWELEWTVFSFTKEKKELETAYQQQVDDMFFYGYRCCMKKHDIIDDIPSIPSYEEDEAEVDDSVGQGDSSGAGDGFATTDREDQDAIVFTFLSFGCLGLLIV